MPTFNYSTFPRLKLMRLLLLVAGFTTLLLRPSSAHPCNRGWAWLLRLIGFWLQAYCRSSWEEVAEVLPLMATPKGPQRSRESGCRWGLAPSRLASWKPNEEKGAQQRSCQTPTTLQHRRSERTCRGIQRDAAENGGWCKTIPLGECIYLSSPVSVKEMKWDLVAKLGYKE